MLVSCLSLDRKEEIIVSINTLKAWCLVMVERLFLAVPGGCLQFVIVVFPDHTHLLFFTYILAYNQESHAEYLGYHYQY